tara:strand:+ start:68 stop:784 length:717 start_codon:yes stop_codon:yes gene_type:complete
MADQNEDDNSGTFASPPCFMHELDPAYQNLPAASAAEQQLDLKRWRKAERDRLVKQRLALDTELRRQQGAQIAANLEAAIGSVEGLTVSAYWPFRGEPNLVDFMKRLAGRGGRCALPVVVAHGKPLLFRIWADGDSLGRGVWNIPIPREDAEVAVPDVVIAPVIGFDRGCYRLGYGGGFYDRTLAALAKKPRLFGVGYNQAAIATIYPQWHDIPMDKVVTETGVICPVEDRLADGHGR